MNERAEPLEVITSNPSCYESDLESHILIYSAGGLFMIMLGLEVMLAQFTTESEVMFNKDLHEDE